MKKKIIVLIFVLFIASVAVMCVLATNSSSQDSTIYNISEDNILESNQCVFQYDNNLIILSSNDNSSLLSMLNLDTGEISNLSTFDFSYTCAKINDDSLFLYNNNTNQASPEVIVYNLTSNNLSNIIFLGNFEATDSITNLAVDDNNNIYLSNNNFIYCYNCNSQLIYTYNLDNTVISLQSTPDNDHVYAITDTCIYELLSSEAKVLDFPFNGTSVSFLENNIAVDNSGSVYYCNNDTWSKRYDSYSSLDTICSSYSNIDVICNNKIYALDSNGNTVGEYSLNLTCNKLLSNDTKLISICDEDNGMQIEVINIDSMGVPNFKILDNDSNTFVAYPKDGDNVYEDISDLSEWKVIIDLDKITSTSRGIPEINITNLNTGENYLRELNDGLGILNNGATLYFDVPDNIDDNSFKIEISNLCTTDGIPAKIIYQVNVSSEDDTNDSEYIDSDIYDIDRSTNTISNIIPGTTLSQLKSNLNYSGSITLVSSNGSLINSGKVGTSDIIYLVKDGQITDSLTIIIYGDLTGDGNITSSDTNILRDYLIGRNTLYKYNNIAANVNHDDTIDNLDLVMINESAKGKYIILQDDNN